MTEELNERVANMKVSVRNGEIDFKVETAGVVGYTKKNIRLGEDRGDMRVFLNKKLINEMVSEGVRNHEKWIIYNDDEDLVREEALMLRDVASVVRRDEKVVIDEYKGVKRSIREKVKERETDKGVKVARKSEK